MIQTFIMKKQMLTWFRTLSQTSFFFNHKNNVFIEITFSGERKNRPRGDRKSTEMSMHLRQALTAAIKTELYPRSQIDVYVEVLQVKPFF